ncbi:23S rRNA (adenine2503-C2)-methyltransferase [Macellibacteroides fermentans]|uniref:Probable dual-specificity RNA methyltransferase RlmN n=2 Tax=Bacteroidales TaxID=171549 RepID=A0A1T5ECA9_9BACT|nr:23S rRNA (adenine2503-C2)-methyltransferase [Parabacteroides chartae]
MSFFDERHPLFFYLCGLKYIKKEDMEAKRRLLGMTLNELKEVASELNLPAYASKQIADWLYKKRIVSISEMTNLSAANRNALSEKYVVGMTSPSEFMKSVDGTIKYLFQVGVNAFVESVYIPEEDRATLCVSSQIGCKMNCSFCMTGRQGFNGNLTTSDIINQIQSIPEYEKLTNIVFMGMGEPLDNADELFKALEILTSSYGYGWSPKRITVSTIGVAKGLQRFLKESDCHLAYSLHSPFPDERLSIMPVEKAFPAKEVIAQIRQFDFSHQRRVSFEYIMFDGLNDDLRHAEGVAKLIAGIPCRVNLIRFHAIPNSPLKSSNTENMNAFRDTLTKKGIVCTIRSSRGEDIFAACGMLSTAKKEQKN